ASAASSEAQEAAMRSLWWLVFVVIWLALTGTRGTAEIAAGVLTAWAAVWWLVAARSRGMLASGLPTLQPLRGLASVPPKLVVESYLVAVSTLLALVGRSPGGHFKEIALPPEARQRGAVYEGLFTLVESFTPNEYVIALDEGRQTAMIHELVSRREE
ncbi:MAG: hypothetical protein ACM3VW_10580, partial [Bacteroidota bacterium]